MDNLMVSVWIITYNHEKYIAQALDGVLMQRTEFEFDIIIGEDCSTDGTREIIKRYEVENPGKFKVIYHDKNVGGMRNAYEYALPACKGKYVACLEGDDFWTDPYKLQKQVDLLEEHPEYSLCFHNAKVVCQNSSKPPHLFNEVTQKKVLHFEDLIERWQIATASMVFRNVDLKVPEWFYQQYNGDMALQFLMIGYGPFIYMEDLMSVYRLHDTGISNIQITNQLKNIDSILRLLDLVDDYHEGKYKIPIENFKIELYKMKKRVRIKTKYPFIQTLRLSIKNGLTSISDKI